MSRRPGLDGATCGLRIYKTPTSHNLTPQETTKPDVPDMGPDGAEFSFPGSSVVAKEPNVEGGVP